MGSSVGRVVRDIIRNGCKPAYFLLGDDFFMQNIFINKLINSFNNTIKSEYFYLNEELDLSSLLNNITSISLFKNNNVYIIKNFNKISKDYQNFLLNHLNQSNCDNTMIFILNELFVLRVKNIVVSIYYYISNLR